MTKFVPSFKSRSKLGLVIALAALTALTACDLPRAVPTMSEVSADLEENTSLTLVQVDFDLAATLREIGSARPSTGRFFPDNEASTGAIGPGDTLEISVLESASGGLFSAVSAGSIGAAGSQMTRLPPITVNAAGQIDFPYLDVMRVSGLDELALGRLIANRLSEKTPSPQVIVRRTSNRSNTVLVLGDVKKTTAIDLSPARETLMEAITAAGGPSNAAGDTVVRLTRAGITRSVRMDTLLTSPDRDIHLRRGDRIALTTEPRAFTILGASGVQLSKPFPSSGITLAEALGAAGGLDDNRANPEGVFVLRHERNTTLRKIGIEPSRDGDTSPTVFQFDMGHLEGTFVAAGFALAPSDIVLIANADSVQIRKFIQIFSSVADAGSTAATLASF